MRILGVTWLLLAASLGLSCAGGVGIEELLRDRAEYTVALVSWVARPDGKIAATLRIDGPLRSDLRTLTVEVVRLGAGGERIGSDWVTLDLSDRMAGVPVEKVVILPADPLPHALAVDMHSHPSEDVLPKLKELEGVPR